MTRLTRRDVLRSVAAGAAGAIVAARRSDAEEAKPDPYGGFRMGMQSYTLRHFDLDGALARYRELDLHVAEFYPSNGNQMQVTADAEKLKTYQTKLKEAGVAIWAFGVVPFGKDHEKNRAVFEFGKAMGLRALTCDPAPDSFESVDRLTKEYGIAIGIHNHGPKHRYDKIDDVMKAVEKWPTAVGACVDTGHFIRSGEDPIEAIRKLGPRVHEVHLKDASAPGVFNVLGEGKLKGRVAELLRALKEIKFAGCLALEYEEKPEDPMDDLKKCLSTVREAVKAI